MITLTALWLPILLSAVFVFVASSVIHMGLPAWHKSDYRKLPDEPRFLDALRGLSIGPGEYMFPCASSMKDMGTPEMCEKFKRGPCGSMVVLPSGIPSMGKSLAQWFLYCVVVSVFAGYIGTLGARASDSYLKVFHITGATAVGIYAMNSVVNSIWKGVSWVVTFKFVVDGVIYGLVTAGTFGWLWPRG